MKLPQMCSEAGGEGLDGFMNFYNCAQNGVIIERNHCIESQTYMFRPWPG